MELNHNLTESISAICHPLKSRLTTKLMSSDYHEPIKLNIHTSGPRKGLPINLMIVFFCLIVILVQLPDVLSQSTHNSLTSNLMSRHSGQFLISQLCATKSQFPLTKIVEGATLSSNADTDINCTITLRTKTSQQYFVIRFERLKLGCDDHLKLFDGDLDYGQPSIKDFSCRDNIASVPRMKTTGTFLTIRYSSDSKAKPDDGFSLVATAVVDMKSSSDCPPDYTYCKLPLCISRSLYCDGVNHCLDDSDEANCNQLTGPGSNSYYSSSLLNGSLSLTDALSLLVVLVLVIFLCVIIFISAIYCRRENPYAQYQYNFQRALGVPMQTSSSLMFAVNQQPQYHYFQPANMSPYVTPQHHGVTTMLPAGYSTLPLNLLRHNQQGPQMLSTKGNPQMPPNGQYLMMTGLARPPTITMQTGPTTQTSLYLPTSQSIMPGSTRQEATSDGLQQASADVQRV